MIGGMTLRQARALAFIKQFQTANGGASPSYAEIGEELGLASKSGVHAILHRMAARGIINMSRGARSISIIGEV